MAVVTTANVSDQTGADDNLGLTVPKEPHLPEIKFEVLEIDNPLEYCRDILALGVTEKEAARTEDDGFLNEFLRCLDASLGGLLSEVAREEDFGGKVGQQLVVRVGNAAGVTVKRVGLFGLGKNASCTTSLKSFSEALATAAKTAHAVAVAVAFAGSEQMSSQEKLHAVSLIATGVILDTFKDDRYKFESKAPTLKLVSFIGLGSENELVPIFKLAEYVSSGVLFSMQLVNDPANVLTPIALAEQASSIASSYSDVLTATILDEEQCKELKMGSYLAVGAASANRPRFIHLCYKPPGGNVKTKLAIVGKGVTFDSGGYNLKTGATSRIEEMKTDMGGAAAVFGTAKAIAQIKPPGVEVHFISPSCENMISGTGYRPGDIITAANGTTIEVNNTDGEGRLTLADALIYACNQGVDKIVDLATLTGACITALGNDIAGVFTPSDELGQELQKASEVAGDKFWRLPLEESYREGLKSGIADMLNVGPSAGGAITAALFLKPFVQENVQWLHIDMAGPVWDGKKKSATGFPVPTLVQWVSSNAA